MTRPLGKQRSIPPPPPPRPLMPRMSQNSKEANRRKKKRRWQNQSVGYCCCCCCWWLVLNIPATCWCISGTSLLSFTSCHAETEVADQTCCLPQSQYTYTGPTSPSADSVMPGAWQGSHCSISVEVTGLTQPGKSPMGYVGIEHRSAALEVDALPLGQRGGLHVLEKQNPKHNQFHTAPVFLVIAGCLWWSWTSVCWLVGCLTSQQQASVSQGRICTDNFTCCHTEIEAADPTFHLTQSQYTDTGLTSPSTDPITPGAWQGSPWSANF